MQDSSNIPLSMQSPSNNDSRTTIKTKSLRCSAAARKSLSPMAKTSAESLAIAESQHDEMPPATAASSNSKSTVTPPKQPRIPSWRTSSFPRIQSRKLRSLMIVVSVLCLLGILGTAGLYLWNRHKQAQAVPDVTLYRTSMQNVNEDIGGGGIFYPMQRLDISYPFSEQITSIFVKPGDQVSPNQPLMQLDVTQLKAQVTQASNDVAAAQAYVNSVSYAGTLLEVDKAEQQLAQAQNRYNAIVAEVSSPTLHNGTLISSIKGTVTDVTVYPGEVLAAHQPLITIMDESTIIVHAKIPVENLGQVRMSHQVIVTPSSLSNSNFNGTIQSIRYRADTGQNTFEVWVNVPNPTGVLLPGMSAFVRIQYPTRALVIPRLALLNPDSSPIVFLVRDGRAYVQSVQVLGYAGDSALVGTGLSTGETIVLVGKDQLQNGQTVHITGIEDSLH